MPFSECVDCNVTFKWSENNHTRRRKPHRCPDCREAHLADVRQAEAESAESADSSADSEEDFS